MYKYLILICLVFIIIITPSFFKKDIIKNPIILTKIKPDTSKIIKPTPPNITYVDTTKHKEIRLIKEEEVKREPIVLVTEIIKKDLIITSIDTMGIIKKDIYNIPIWSEITIKNNKVKIRKRILPRILLGVGILATSTISFLIIKNKLKNI